MFTLAALCLSVWVFFGSYSSTFGLPLPALGPFLHPTTGFWRQASPLLTQAPQGQLLIDHPLALGRVYYDERQVPHIFTDSLAQAVFIQGYITARDRLWQMDVSTRSTGGRLAEVFGERLAARDRSQIRNGYRRAAQQAVKVWQQEFPADYRLVTQYTEGVNAYIRQLKPADYPLEFKLLGYQPSLWTPYHTALMLKGMTQSMSDRNHDLAHQHAWEQLEAERYQSLYPQRNPNETPIVPSGTSFSTPKTNQARQRAPLPFPDLMTGKASSSQSMHNNQLPPQPTGHSRPTSWTNTSPEQEASKYPFAYRENNGSNNWAIAGSKSQTKRPILAGDPHLSLSLPSIWYELQIHTTESNCQGVSLPGLPLIVIGFNESIAWSMTNGGQDVVDWYKMNWLADDFSAYQIGQTRHTTTFDTDTLYIKGQAPEIIVTPWTLRGPVPESSDTSSIYYGLAKDAISHYTQTDRPGTEVSTMRQMMAAKGYQDFKTALQSYSEPLMNFAFADKSGTVSIVTAGFFPLRQGSTDDGWRLSDGSRDSANWMSYLPFEDAPESYNPQRGFVASANQVSTDASFPYRYYGNFPTYRGQYINRRLAQYKTTGQREMKALQMDAHSVLAEELTPLLLARINRNQLAGKSRSIFQELADWDYHFTADSKAATFFERWRKKLEALTTDEISTQAGFPALAHWRLVYLLRRSPEHPIFDLQATPGKETAAIITQRAFDEVIEELEGQDPPPWGKENQGRIEHIGRIPGFGIDILDSDGHFSAPNALRGGHGSSWRMVVELGEKPRAWGLLPGGASGNPGSSNYTAGVTDWTKGRYYELVYWRDLAEAEREAEGRIVNFTNQ